VSAGTRPSVSIIMPTFNRLAFLKPAIASAFDQTFEDWELIIADDGSSEPTRAYLRQLQTHPRVQVIWRRHTGRPSAVSNVALREARGEYVAFLDSDDIWMPKKLETQIASLRRHPECGWSYTKFALIDASGNRIDPACSRDWPTPTGWILERLLEENTVIAQPSVVVSRQMLLELGAFDEDLVMCYDDELWFRLAAHSEIDGIDEALTLVRRHGEHSGSDIIAWRDRRRVFKKALQASHGRRLDEMLRRLHAQMSAGLAISQARSGRRWDALATLCSSAPDSWRYPRYWLGAWISAARACAPQSVRTLARRFRRGRPLARS
jgi:glycosyltransferase involved in cell wall biosynthesis